METEFDHEGTILFLKIGADGEYQPYHVGRCAVVSTKDAAACTTPWEENVVHARVRS